MSVWTGPQFHDTTEIFCGAGDSVTGCFAAPRKPILTKIMEMARYPSTAICLSRTMNPSSVDLRLALAVVSAGFQWIIFKIMNINKITRFRKLNIDKLTS